MQVMTPSFSLVLSIEALCVGTWGFLIEKKEPAVDCLDSKDLT